MRTIIISILLTIACSAFAETNETAIKNYKKQYTVLVTKWEKEKDAKKRQSIKLEIEKLKSTNTNLFHRK
jgi:Mg2+/Co2+ transporter CorB